MTAREAAVPESSCEHALSLLAAVKNQEDVSTKLKLLNQAKEIIHNLNASSVPELFESTADLHVCSESLVKECLVQMMEELGLKAIKHSVTFMPALLELLNDEAPGVVKQCIITGTNLLRKIFKELVMQSHQDNMVESWHEELWAWMRKIKDSVCRIAMEPGLVGTRLLAIKFLEVYTLLLTSKDVDFGSSMKNGINAFLDLSQMTQESSEMLSFFLNLLSSSSSLQGSLVIGITNCLASIARKNPYHFSAVLSALLEFVNNIEVQKNAHRSSIQYSLKNVFLRFLKCSHPVIGESREKLIEALKTVNAGAAVNQVRHSNKITRVAGRASQGDYVMKEQVASDPMSVSVEIKQRKHVNLDNGFKALDEGIMSFDGICSGADAHSGNISPTEHMIAMIRSLLAEGERGSQSLEILISNIQPDLMADIVITNMKDLSPCPPPLYAAPSNFPAASDEGYFLS